MGIKVKKANKTKVEEENIELKKTPKKEPKKETKKEEKEAKKETKKEIKVEEVKKKKS